MHCRLPFEAPDHFRMFIVEPNGLSQFGKIHSKLKHKDNITGTMMHDAHHKLHCRGPLQKHSMADAQPSFSQRGGSRSTVAVADVNIREMVTQVHVNIREMVTQVQELTWPG